MITGVDYGYWKRQEQRWAAMAEGAPDETAREYIYGAFERSSQALAGLEKALVALGLLEGSKELDLQSPHPQTRADVRVKTLTAQQEASWRERALNAEEEVRKLRQEVTNQRRLVGDLMGQRREPDGTWVEHDQDRLRKENVQLLAERNQLVGERDDLRRRLYGARAKVSQLNERWVTELFPDGPGRTRT